MKRWPTASSARRAFVRRSSSIVWLALVGCEASSSASDAGETARCGQAQNAGTVRIELGAGEEHFREPIAGEKLEIISGPQGGFHVWTAIRVLDTTATCARVWLATRFLDDGVAAGRASNVCVTLGETDEGGVREKAGLFSFIDEKDMAANREIVFSARVETCGGKSGDDELTVGVE